MTNCVQLPYSGVDIDLSNVRAVFPVVENYKYIEPFHLAILFAVPASDISGLHTLFYEDAAEANADFLFLTQQLTIRNDKFRTLPASQILIDISAVAGVEPIIEDYSYVEPYSFQAIIQGSSPKLFQKTKFWYDMPSDIETDRKFLLTK